MTGYRYITTRGDQTYVKNKKLALRRQESDGFPKISGHIFPPSGGWNHFTVSAIEPPLTKQACYLVIGPSTSSGQVGRESSDQIPRLFLILVELYI